MKIKDIYMESFDDCWILEPAEYQSDRVLVLDICVLI